jgi:hypothetical protein
MEDNRRQSGFSLIETMLAVATLAVGMVFVAGTFTAGVYFASVSTESTVATVVTDEAVAKITLFGLDLDNASRLRTDAFVAYEDVCAMNPNEFTYPSTSSDSSPEYAWSAICRKEGSDSRLVEFTVFVSRLMGVNAKYWERDENYKPKDPGSTTSPGPSLPRPVRIQVTGVRAIGTAASELTVQDDTSTTPANESIFLNAGFMIVSDDATGQIYRVLERYDEELNGETPIRGKIKITPAWQGAATGGSVWMVPRPVTGGRCPLVTVYQKVIRF